MFGFWIRNKERGNGCDGGGAEDVYKGPPAQHSLMHWMSNATQEMHSDHLASLHIPTPLVPGINWPNVVIGRSQGINWLDAVFCWNQDISWVAKWISSPIFFRMYRGFGAIYCSIGPTDSLLSTEDSIRSIDTIIPCLFMQYEKIFMVWFVSHKAVSRVWYEPNPLIFFLLHENKQGVINLSLSRHKFS